MGGGGTFRLVAGGLQFVGVYGFRGLGLGFIEIVKGLDISDLLLVGWGWAGVGGGAALGMAGLGWGGLGWAAPAGWGWAAGLGWLVWVDETETGLWELLGCGCGLGWAGLGGLAETEISS